MTTHITGCMPIAMLTIAAAVACSPVAAEDAPSAAAAAASIVQTTGVRGGLIVHVGCGDGKLTAAFCAGDGYLVHGIDVSAEHVQTAREHVRRAGLYGKVSIDRFDGLRLPYVDNLVNLIVVEKPADVPPAELMRVLAPQGVVYVKTNDGWTKTVKPRPAEIDEWTHWLHGPDGNAVADDRVVGPPRHVQWLADPRWQRHHEKTPSLSAMVSSGGRLFAIIDEAPPGVDGLGDRWSLIARDAFNGILLWKRPITEWGPGVWSDHSYGQGRWNHPTHIARRLVAIGDRVYVTLGFNASLTALDAASGKTVMTYPQSQFTDEILYHEGTLVVTVNNAAQGPGHVREKPPVTKSVVAINAQTGSVLWKTGDFTGVASKADAIERVTHLEMTLGGGKVFLVEEDAVVALDLKTGERVWRRERPPRPRVVTYGNYYLTNLCSLVYHDGVVFLTEPDPKPKRVLAWNAPTKSTVAGISAETGKDLWTRPCGIWGHYGHGDLFVIDELAWVHDAPDFRMVGLDPQTGDVKRTLSTRAALDQGHHHRCYRNKATVRYILTGRRGIETIDLQSEENLRHHWVRGTCRYGILPCNGLIYAPPHPCICYITAKLNGFWALAAQRKAESGKRKAEATTQLERGPAYSLAPSPQSPTPNPSDWPTYRHDAARSGCAATALAADLQLAWEAELGERPSSPVIADGKLLVALPDAHVVRALDATDGKPLWSYTAGGRVDTPPTVYRGLALFGSADGWVYCLRISDGTLAWRLRAAPEETRIIARGRLESPWPVHGSVLISDGVAYFAAGRSSFLDGGIYVFAVDPITGNVLRKNRIYSPDPETGDMVEARLAYDMPPDALGALPDVLVGDGTNVYMRHLKFDPADLSYRSAAPPADGKVKRGAFPDVGTHLMSGAGLLDDQWFNQTYWTIDGKSQSKLLVFDRAAAYGVKPFPGNARHSRAVFRPGTEGYTLFAAARPSHQSRWKMKVPVRVRAMLAAGETLYIAGSPDTVTRSDTVTGSDGDPYGAFDGRQGAVLWAVSTSDGSKLAEYKLDAPPVFDGMAAAADRLYVSTTAGRVVCLGGK
ncbi:MAG: PQQ-binding-like beta-propeller repeat protein [Candidatus Nealsonbacteria bacterium]|nr:PQQ-binding-like beta-propeller repeat protein [Candidatus Nealsonbacteria bacterium]